MQFSLKSSEGTEMPQSFGRRVVVSLLVGVAIATGMALMDIRNGLSWRELGPVWVHPLLALTGATSWFLMDLGVRGLSTLGRRQA